jgi:hypothetical protein
LKDQDDHGFEASNSQPPPIPQAYPEIIELKGKKNVPLVEPHQLIVGPVRLRGAQGVAGSTRQQF